MPWSPFRARGVEFRPEAPVVLREEARVGAPPGRVWEVLVRVERWPSWHPGIRFATLQGELTPGSLLQWQADGMRISSVVGEVEVRRRVGWTLRTLGARGYQRWTLEALPGGGARVLLEESWEGLPVWLFRGTLRRTLQLSRGAWLEGLSRESASGEA